MNSVVFARTAPATLRRTTVKLFISAPSAFASFSTSLGATWSSDIGVSWSSMSSTTSKPRLCGSADCFKELSNSLVDVAPDPLMLLHASQGENSKNTQKCGAKFEPEPSSSFAMQQPPQAVGDATPPSGLISPTRLYNLLAITPSDAPVYLRNSRAA
jgi:hypothetical protein